MRLADWIGPNQIILGSFYVCGMIIPILQLLLYWQPRYKTPLAP